MGNPCDPPCSEREMKRQDCKLQLNQGCESPPCMKNVVLALIWMLLWNYEEGRKTPRRQPSFQLSPLQREMGFLSRRRWRKHFD